MKTIIAGCRDFRTISVTLIRDAIVESHFKITQVVSGGAQGVDASGEAFARLNGIDLKIFPADWGKHGRSAGPIRNSQMAEYADALIAVWDGKSRGTKNMIDQMNKLGKPVFIKFFERTE